MPNCALQTFTDPYEYQSAVRAADVAVLLTGGGEFQAKLTTINLHRLWMRSGETSTPYIMRGAWTNERIVVSFLVGPAQAPYHHNGVELTPGMILVNPLGTEFHRRSTGRRCGSMSLAPDELAASARAIVGRDLTAPAETQLVQPPPQMMVRLLNLYEAAENLAETTPDLLAHPEVARAIEDELVRAMVACLAQGQRVGRSDNAVGRRIPVMQRFERFLEANRGEPLYLAEVCAAIGVSDRTLRLHCQEHLGVSPQRYLWLRRIHQVHRALTRADARRKTVTEIATDHGFWELGRFSVAYRQIFGERPSVTLHRAI